MIDAVPTPSLPRHTRLIRVAMAALIVLLLGSLFGAGAAQAKKKKPPRIVALSPFAYNTMAKLRVRPVAVGQTLSDDVKKDGWLKRKNVRVLTLSHPNGPNLEELARLRPDIVITSSRWRKGTAGMKQLGIKKVKYFDPTSIKATKNQVLKIGRLTGRRKQARKLKKRMSKQIRRESKRTNKRPKVMLILGVGRTPFTFLHHSWGGRIMKKAQGNLLTGGVNGKGGFARISDEVVVAQNPDVIIAVPHGDITDIDAMKDYIYENQAWASTTAVKRKQVFISIDNSLLQASTDIGRTIKMVRKKYLKNYR